MEKTPSVFLRREIMPEDCENMIRWLENEHVSRYLNESADLAGEMRDLLARTPEDMLTFQFNRSGSFYLVCDRRDASIGYARLAPLSGNRLEAVYVIGEEDLWGRGMGRQALQRIMSVAFLEKRADALLARIRLENLRSLHLAESCGMRQIGTLGRMAVFEMTAGQYLKRRSTS